MDTAKTQDRFAWPQRSITDLRLSISPEQLASPSQPELGEGAIAEKHFTSGAMPSPPRRKVPRNWYTTFVYPVLRSLPNAEQSNSIAKTALRIGGSLLRDKTPDAPELRSVVWSREFSNPIGLAAEFDKDAEVYRQIGGIGFGFVEIGTITPRYQAGNDKPRVFRLPHDLAAINRMGFPSQGLEYARSRLERNLSKPRRPIGINIGANKESADRAADYAICAGTLAPYADYLVCNVSSPNTPGLRTLQGREQLSELIQRVQDAMSFQSAPLLVKIAPDMNDRDLDDVVDVARRHCIDGIIVSNTTLTRPNSLISGNHDLAGGLSGAPLTNLSTDVLRRTAQRVEGQFPLIGCGGVSCGLDAYVKIRSGASLVQLYTALMYEGPPLVHRIKSELTALLRRDGFSSVSQAIGADLRG